MYSVLVDLRGAIRVLRGPAGVETPAVSPALPPADAERLGQHLRLDLASVPAALKQRRECKPHERVRGWDGRLTSAPTPRLPDHTRQAPKNAPHTHHAHDRPASAGSPPPRSAATPEWAAPDRAPVSRDHPERATRPGLQHLEQTAVALSADDSARAAAKAVIVEEVERLHWRLWNGKTKDAQISIDRIRAVTHHFRREQSLRKSFAPSRKLWTALHALDGYLTGQSIWLVNYAERHRAGLRVGTAITEGTANFLVNRRMNKS